MRRKKHFRLIAVGKKQLPDPDAGGGGKGQGRKATFWATVVTVGEDLKKLQDGLGGKEYETKTKGERSVLTLENKGCEPHLCRNSSSRPSPPGRQRRIRDC